MSNFTCEVCGRRFTDPLDYNGHKLDHMNGMVDDSGEVEESGNTHEVIEAKPLPPAKPPAKETKAPVLNYTYTGDCATCGIQLETIVLDGVLSDKDKVVVVAWCPDCRIKQIQRTVAKL